MIRPHSLTGQVPKTLVFSQGWYLSPLFSFSLSLLGFAWLCFPAIVRRWQSFSFFFNFLESPMTRDLDLPFPVGLLLASIFRLRTLQLPFCYRRTTLIRWACCWRDLNLGTSYIYTLDMFRIALDMDTIQFCLRYMNFAIQSPSVDLYCRWVRTRNVRSRE